VSTIYVILALALGYLSGSVNYAIIVSRLVSGKDIREVGNLNPGTANVTRSIGKFWGVVVGILDGLKSFAPMFITSLFFSTTEPSGFFVIMGAGLAALIGHWKPVFHGFNGGRGVGCIIGIYLFILPVEFIISFLLGGFAVIFFFKNVKFRYGRWVPIMFVLISPFLTLVLNFFIHIDVIGTITLGGHPWFVVIGAFITSFSMLFINFTFMGRRVDEYKQSR
jgi:acyl phosphate:glycerol-3-phosphate acyltransferase